MKVGPDKLVKFLIYLLVFLILVLGFVFLFILPQIKEFKTAKAEYFSTLRSQKILKKEKKEFIEELNSSKIVNKKIITLFSQKFSEDKFITFSKNYFDDVKLTPVEGDTNSSALKIYFFNATIKAKNPRKFYNFVNDLKKYNGLIKINFPITITTKNGHLNINFHMSIYSMSLK